MRTRILVFILFVLSLAFIGLALGYSYYEVKNVSGLVRDPNGHPIAKAALTIAGRSALTDDSGHFEVMIPQGTWLLRGFGDGYTPGQESITVQDLDQKNLSADLVLPLNEFTGSVIATDVHKPIAGASVQVAGGSNFKTDPRGTFTLRGIKSGTTLAISAPGYQSASFTVEPTGPSELALSPAITRLSVAEEYSHKPLPNITVTAGDQSVQTDQQGQAVLRALQTGVTITAEAKGYAPASVPYDGEGELTLALRPNTLDGRITDAGSHKPVSGALILYSGKMLKSDAAGAFHLDQVQEGITLTIKQPGYRLASFQIQHAGRAELALTPFKAKGIHIYYTMPRDQVLAMLDQVRGTEVNTVVLDVKEGPGDIMWPSAVPLAQQINAYHARGIPPSELVQVCRERNWYCIARMVLFKDTRLGSAHPEWALHYSGGGILNAGNEIWMNPAKTEVWDYNLALAKELSALGFDEVQFDYIRYPGNRIPLEFGTTESRLATIRKFLETASAALKPLPVFFSGDVFGLTTATRDEQGIGQRLEIDAPYFDYLSPMMYPSTWKGSSALFRAGLRNPSCVAALACPYEIVKQGTLIARERTGGVLIRPWLQAYTDAGFGLSEYVLQKNGADDADSAGWLFWNNQGIYPDGMFDK